MLPRADLNSTRPAAPVDAPSPVASSTDARGEILHRLLQVAAGRQLQATVASLFDDGSALVKVEDIPLRMNLPAGIRPGDTLSMVLLAHQPRPTFLLAGQPGSADTLLSPAARLVDRLLQTVEHDGMSPTVKSPLPLLASPGHADGARLATALHEGVEFSGLFYESHLQQWLEGSRSITQLRREPQAAPGFAVFHPDLASAQPAAQLHANSPSHVPAAATQEAPVVPHGSPSDAGHGRLPSIQSAGMPMEAELLTASHLPEPTLDPDSARLLGAQLHTMEQRQLIWQGELWPGQPLEWEISEGGGRADQDGHGGLGQDRPDWTSKLRFELPTLGGISAILQLSGDRVRVRVDAASAAAAASLRAHAGLLAEAMATAGTPLDQLSVKQDDAA